MVKDGSRQGSDSRGPVYAPGGPSRGARALRTDPATARPLRASRASYEIYKQRGALQIIRARRPFTILGPLRGGRGPSTRSARRPQREREETRRRRRRREGPLESVRPARSHTPGPVTRHAGGISMRSELLPGENGREAALERTRGFLISRRYIVAACLELLARGPLQAQ